MVLLVTRESPDAVYSVKFIAQEKWFATGDGHGWVNVYAHTSSVTANVIKKIRAHGGKPVTSLAVHPTYPYLLTSSKYDNSIELWDWGQGWSCVRTFDGHIAGVGNLTFNRWDIKSFASVGYDNREAKVCTWLGYLIGLFICCAPAPPLPFLHDDVTLFLIGKGVLSPNPKYWYCSTTSPLHIEN